MGQLVRIPLAANAAYAAYGLPFCHNLIAATRLRFPDEVKIRSSFPTIVPIPS